MNSMLFFLLNCVLSPGEKSKNKQTNKPSGNEKKDCIDKQIEKEFRGRTEQIGSPKKKQKTKI